MKSLTIIWAWLVRLWKTIRHRTKELHRTAKELRCELDPNWVNLPPCDPLSISPGNTTVQFVSRHSLAEGGLYLDWPGERIKVCEAGEFHRIRRGRLASTGEEVECIVFDYQNASGQSATYYLVASPDTEHGDDIKLNYCPAEDRPQLLDCFNRFVRRAVLDIDRERWGLDIKHTVERGSEHGSVRPES